MPESYTPASMWNDVGQPPADDVVEVSLLGPGFGESIVIHLGKGNWIIVDSCVDLSDGEEQLSAPLRYLRALGIEVHTQVKLIIATHWHNDHIKGMSELVKNCRSAEFSCGSALSQQEFFDFIEAMAAGSLSTHGAKVTEIRATLQHLSQHKIPVQWAHPGRELLACKVGHDDSERCTVRALSPSDSEYQLFLREVVLDMPQFRSPQRAAVARSPNTAAVVVQVEWPCDAALLGADMVVTRDPQRGWAAVVKQAGVVLARKASFVKLPHHGSYTGHYEEMWSQLLEQRPIGALTPFNRGPGSSRPPTDADVARISALCGESYATSNRAASVKRTRDRAVERSLAEAGIKTRDLRQPMGMVRLRRSAAGPWRTELFPPACQLINFSSEPA